MTTDRVGAILRYQVSVDDQEHAIVSDWPLAVECRWADVVDFWAYAGTAESRVESRTYLVVGTGHPFDAGRWAHVGTVCSPARSGAIYGALVWHLLVERTS